MKTTIQSLATLLLLIVSSASYSVDPPAQRNLQVMPAESGILKLLYVNPEADEVKIRICNDAGVFFTDKVKVKENGFLARYNVRDITCEEFWVEISDEDTVTRFRITQDEWGNLRAAYW